jgi:predicted urease superfamily metal-dependent hydrolase
LGFEDVDEANVDELLRSHTEELTNEDLLELEKDLNKKGDESSVVKLLSTKQVAEFFKHIDTAIGIAIGR